MYYFIILYIYYFENILTIEDELKKYYGYSNCKSNDEKSLKNGKYHSFLSNENKTKILKLYRDICPEIYDKYLKNINYETDYIIDSDTL